MQQVIAHIDMDCFFCSCEEKKDPLLKGKPVIVGGKSDRGVASAANYEARKYGVFSATPIAKAKKLCPKGIFLPVDYQYYKKESNHIMEIFSRFTDNMLQVSVDEAYLDLTEFSKQFSSLKEMAKVIQNQVKQETELTCSIGVAESKTVAKIASDFHKPFGITIVEDAKIFLKDLSIGKIPGIGKVSKENYENKGVMTIGDLAELSQSKVFELFGSQGLHYHRIANGLDFSKIEAKGKTKSLSREHTFSKNISDVFELEKIIDKLCEETKDDLKNHFFKTVSIKIKFEDFSTITRDTTLKTPINSLKKIKEETLKLFRSVINAKQKIRLLGVKLSNLSDENSKQETLHNF